MYRTYRYPVVKTMCWIFLALLGKKSQSLKSWDKLNGPPNIYQGDRDDARKLPPSANFIDIKEKIGSQITTHSCEGGFGKGN